MARTTRDDIINRVHDGELAPDAAEAVAKQHGVGPLAHAPEPAEFDPGNTAFWSLPMTLAWVTSRSLDLVREMWDEYRLKSWDWHFREWRVGPDGPIREGHFLEQRTPATLLTFTFSYAAWKSAGRLPPFAPTIEQAQQQLWSALQNDVLQATGIFDGDPVRKSIPASLWLDLELIEEQKRVVLCPRAETITGRSRIREIALPKDSVMAAWSGWATTSPVAELPPLILPHEPGYMPLFSAVHWVAAEGGGKSIEAGDEAAWLEAYRSILARIASEDVKVTGHRNGVTELIPGFHFASMPVSAPFSEPSFEMILGKQPFLMSYPYIDDEHWRKGFDDSIQGAHGALWKMLMVLRSDVARFWPFQEQRDPPVRTGAAGRPSSMHLVKAELERRRDARLVESGIRDEAKALERWYGQTHPAGPRLGWKAIENSLRAELREAVQSRK